MTAIWAALLTRWLVRSRTFQSVHGVGRSSWSAEMLSTRATAWSRPLAMMVEVVMPSVNPRPQTSATATRSAPDGRYLVRVTATLSTSRQGSARSSALTPCCWSEQRSRCRSMRRPRVGASSSRPLRTSGRCSGPAAPPGRTDLLALAGFLALVSIFQVLPDWVLADLVGTLRFPDNGGPRVDDVIPLAMAAMWVAPLFAAVALSGGKPARAAVLAGRDLPRHRDPRTHARPLGADR